MTNPEDDPPSAGLRDETRPDSAVPVIEAAEPEQHRRSRERPRTLSKEREAEPLAKVVEMAMGFTAGNFPGFHPLFEKFNDKHIDKFLEGIQKDDDNAHQIRRTSHYFHLAYTLIALGFFAFLGGSLKGCVNELKAA